MGFFHAGHEKLMCAGRGEADKLIVSLFVNPTQFGPAEDFSRYPRDPEGDAAVALRNGADILFTPTAEDMYYPDDSTWVSVPALSATLCGIRRPLHFRGVATVVSKLFMLTQPTAAFFGEKDWQQLAVLRRMVRDLYIPVRIVGIPLVREPDGLALSSRNAYLSAEERAQAPHLYKGLCMAKDLVQKGVRDTSVLAAAVREYWSKNFPLCREDYLDFVHPESLESVADASGPTLAAVAIFVSRARLIDNLIIT
jgi:pantoate--beta-alanine ligase